MADDPSPPELPGAETNAPAGLNARSSPEGARFDVFGRGRFLRIPIVVLTEVVVRRNGVDLVHSGETSRVDLDALTGCALVKLPEGVFLALRGAGGRAIASAPAGDDPESQWLARYIDAHIQRYVAASDDPATAERARAQLQGIGPTD